MFSRKISPSLEIKLSIPKYVPALYTLVDENRDFLKEWLPWVDYVVSEEDTRDFIQEQLLRFAKGEAVHVTIFYEGTVVGVAGFNTVDHINGIGYMGYWLAEQYNGKGIMTQVVSNLVEMADVNLALQKVDIRCATDNAKSRAIPKRLGFKHEGTLRRAEKLRDSWLDHEVYAYLIN